MNSNRLHMESVFCYRIINHKGYLCVLLQSAPISRNMWLLAALLGHSAWGIYPVLARYLQLDAHLPGMTLLMVANGSALIIMAVVVWWRGELQRLLVRAGWLVALFAASPRHHQRISGALCPCGTSNAHRASSHRHWWQCSGEYGLMAHRHHAPPWY
jgi:hypothetical protein